MRDMTAFGDGYRAPLAISDAIKADGLGFETAETAKSFLAN